MSLISILLNLNVVVILINQKKQQHDQFFFCHTECFKKKLHENLRSHFILDKIND